MTQHTDTIALRDPTSNRAIRLAVVVFAAALLMGLAAGCGSGTDEQTPLATDQQVEQALRSARLSAVPPEVAEMITLDLGPNAVIEEDVVAKDSPAGIIYPVLYIENGQAHRVTYDRSGQRIEDDSDLTDGPDATAPPETGNEDDDDLEPPDAQGTGRPE